jgi:hypothetical protein
MRKSGVTASNPPCEQQHENDPYEFMPGGHRFEKGNKRVHNVENDTEIRHYHQIDPVFKRFNKSVYADGNLGPKRSTSVKLA